MRNLHITVTSWCGCQICSGGRRQCSRVLNTGAQNMLVYMVCVTVILGDVCVTWQSTISSFLGGIFASTARLLLLLPNKLQSLLPPCTPYVCVIVLKVVMSWLNIHSWVVTCAPAVFFPTGMGMISRLFLRTGVQWTREYWPHATSFWQGATFWVQKHFRTYAYASTLSLSPSLSLALSFSFSLSLSRFLSSFSLSLCLIHSLFCSRTFSLSLVLSHTHKHINTQTHT